jgi:hypothetical protein
LLALAPQEIQVGILKRLRGTPIVRHDQAWEMIYSPDPPYEILQNKLLDFTVVQRLRRFARFWDLIGNSGNFSETSALLCRTRPSAFDAFTRWSDWLFARAGRQHSLALDYLGECLFHYLTQECGQPKEAVAGSIWRDWQRAGRREKPAFLVPLIPESELPPPRRKSLLPKRQARHLGLTQTHS